MGYNHQESLENTINSMSTLVQACTRPCPLILSGYVGNIIQTDEFCMFVLLYIYFPMCCLMVIYHGRIRAKIT